MKFTILSGGDLDAHRFVGDMARKIVHLAPVADALKALTNTKHKVTAACGDQVQGSWVGKAYSEEDTVCPRCKPHIEAIDTHDANVNIGGDRGKKKNT